MDSLKDAALLRVSVESLRGGCGRGPKSADGGGGGRIILCTYVSRPTSESRIRQRPPPPLFVGSSTQGTPFEEMTATLQQAGGFTKGPNRLFPPSLPRHNKKTSNIVSLPAVRTPRRRRSSFKQRKGSITPCLRCNIFYTQIQHRLHYKIQENTIHKGYNNLHAMLHTAQRQPRQAWRLQIIIVVDTKWGVVVEPANNSQHPAHIVSQPDSHRARHAPSHK